MILRHVGIVTRSAEHAAEFWRTVFEFEIVSDVIEEGPHIDLLLGMQGVRVRSIKLKSKCDMHLELLEFQNPKTIFRNDLDCPLLEGFTHIALTVKSLDETLKTLLSVGGRLVGEPTISANGKTRGVYCASPEKLLLELVENV
jgi:catechol 2,3-dioxygenase-like lactoylglutathione lyase family enzyme